MAMHPRDLGAVGGGECPSLCTLRWGQGAHLDLPQPSIAGSVKESRGDSLKMTLYRWLTKLGEAGSMQQVPTRKEGLELVLSG